MSEFWRVRREIDRIERIETALKALFGEDEYFELIYEALGRMGGVKARPFTKNTLASFARLSNGGGYVKPGPIKVWKTGKRPKVKKRRGKSNPGSFSRGSR